MFTFRERSVYYQSFKEEDRVYHLCYDMVLANTETTDFVMRIQRSNNAKTRRIEIKECKIKNKKKPKLTDIELEALKNSLTAPMEDIQNRKSIGTFILCADWMELSTSEVYEIYKRKQKIEQSFKGYDDTLGCKASCMRTHEGMECWLFINHLALADGVPITQ